MPGVYKMTELCNLARKWTTDKALYYSPFYHSVFKDRRNEVRKVLEFGIGYPELMMQPASRIGARYYIVGASLFMWEEYFPNAEIYALDNRRSIFINSGRIHSFYCEQSNESSYAEVIEAIGKDFDLIIDDGSHEPEDQILCANMLSSLLGENGIYVMEDAPLDGYEYLFDLIQFPVEIHDFKDNPKDPARLVVIRR
jgi:hypothetical protein